MKTRKIMRRGQRDVDDDDNDKQKQKPQSFEHLFTMSNSSVHFVLSEAIVLSNVN